MIPTVTRKYAQRTANTNQSPAYIFTKNDNAHVDQRGRFEVLAHNNRYNDLTLTLVETVAPDPKKAAFGRLTLVANHVCSPSYPYVVIRDKPEDRGRVIDLDMALAHYKKDRTLVVKVKRNASIKFGSVNVPAIVVVVRRKLV